MFATPILESLATEDYLAAEQLSAIKHEYIDGQVYAMAGASDNHVTIALNLAALLKTHLRGSKCRTYISDMKVRIEELNIFYYPDVLVTCDERDRSTSTYKRYPSVIAEVLSSSTEAFDRGDKFLDYQHIETLTDYLLINTTRQRIDGFCRRDDGLWVMQSYAVGQTLTLPNLQFEASVEALYEEVN
ncbi:MAG: Uma2 family endonuclease [Thermosynechococcaceae cyanobacterium]